MLAAVTATAAAAVGQSAVVQAAPSLTCPTTTLPKGLQPVVEIATGHIRGIENGGVRSFKGIPYGASTTGRNRFQPPQPPAPAPGVRDMLVFGAACPFRPGGPQNTPASVPPEDAFLLYRSYLQHSAHEDCLRLNVWAPSGSGRRPVMVYMHGGGFTGGSGNDLLAYDGENLARRGDVVVVTHNHRLNLFGYLDLSSFGGRWSQSANVGMQDIVAVLRWVHDNIAAFGGDPNNVTIFGQSGGGGKVLTLMAMPSAAGLFHKAIVQSGAGAGPGVGGTDAANVAREVLASLEISESNLDELAEVPVEKLCQVALAKGSRWRPSVDGSVLPVAPGEREGLAPGVPLVVGTNLNELRNAVDDPRSATFSDTDLTAAAEKKFGAAGVDIVAAYKNAHPGRAAIEIWYVIEASEMRRHSFELTDRKYTLDGKAWQYMFSWATPMLEGRPKTFHSAEIAFVFNNAGLCVNQTGGGPAAIRLAAQMSDSWVAFARRGDPTHGAIPKWPAYTADHPTMIFDDPCRIQINPEIEGLRLVAAAASRQGQ
jgi:para-nitrobenzyl esterase